MTYDSKELTSICELIDGFFSPEEVALSFLIRSVKINSKASLIRLGDGEAKLIGYPEYVSRDKVLGQCRIWFGEKKFDDIDLFFLKYQVEGSLQSADILGLPTVQRITAKNDEGEYTKDAQNCFSLWLSLLNKFGEDFFRKKIIVSANVNHWMQKSKGIKRVLGNAQDVAFINHSFNLPEVFFKAFSFNSVAFYPVPGETWSRFEKVSNHYPERFSAVNKELCKYNLSGKVFFIGAGVLGKLYSEVVRECGGVAIDMGAVLDGWNQNIPSERGMMKKQSEIMTVQYLLS